MAMPTLGQLFQRLLVQSIEGGVGLLKYFFSHLEHGRHRLENVEPPCWPVVCSS